MGCMVAVAIAGGIETGCCDEWRNREAMLGRWRDF